MTASDEKTCPRCAETIKAAAKVCRYCGHEFGGPAEQREAMPKGGGKFKYGCAWAFIVVIILMIIGSIAGSRNPSGSSQEANSTGTASSDTPPAGIVGSADAVSSSQPPDGFRGIKWDSRIPSVAKIHASVMKACTRIQEQTDLMAILQCSHMHIDTDDIENFNQRENTPPFLGVPLSGQMFTWSYRKFWSGEVFSKDEAAFAAFRKQLTSDYGPPTFENGSLHIVKWKWSTPSGKVVIQLFLDNHKEVSLLFSKED